MILNLYIIIYIYIYDILLYDYVLFVCGRTCFFFCGGNLQKCLISHVSACVVLIDMEVRLIKWTKLKDFKCRQQKGSVAWTSIFA